ncbi:MAG TPA: ComEC/Rec2 family competence protein [Acidimicrobiia bacterium]|nr:ComEC/Rec2 family competence protein [Acidimicrobiia bacterium]
MAAAVWVIAAIVASSQTASTFEPGSYDGVVRLVGEVMEGRFGPWGLGEVESATLLVDFDDIPDAGRGDILDVVGIIGGASGTASGRPYGAVLRVREVRGVTRSRFLPHRAGRAVASAVEERLQPFDDGRALLAGFLIGDTSRISEADIDAMRRSGLAHFVAVSGSNVALFLVLLAVAAGPLALGPRRRAVLGLVALPVYVAATRFEPSVMRASFMAGIALAGRLVGVVLEAWQLLALAVICLLVLDPAMTSNVGFQLSVAATGGVLIGARWPLKGRVARALAVTLGAQLAVAPLLIVHFDFVPLLSPLVNLAAGPLVAASTVLGAIGVAGAGVLVAPATWLADGVLALARGAAGWPQLSGWELIALLISVLAVLMLSRIRAIGAVAGSLLLVVAVVAPEARLSPGQVVVADVGQGDAILLHGGDGRFALVDGGPDERVIVEKLRSYGVRSLELVILTHVHADHAGGLSGVVDAVSIGEIWAIPEPHATPAASEFFAALESRGLEAVEPAVGTRRQLGALTLVVEGPVRRYASPNDQSIVLTVNGPTRTMLLSGDIETHAQADLSHLRADVLKVPHQGAGTSDRDWLADVGSKTAVISVGPNQFGHPVEWVIEVLEEDNEVLRTDRDGDVIVDLAA